MESLDSTSNDYDGAKILVCDDDLTHLMLMKETLESSGFDVYEASDGNTAMEIFLQEKPDLVLLDVHMPGLSGFDVCSQIRSQAQGSDTPIVMVTGADDFTSIKYSYALGATDFLPKPIKWPMMAYRVRYILKNHNLVTDLKRSEERLRHLAYHDSLTGLPNRQSFNEHLSRFISVAKRNDTFLAVLFIDLDRFKRINDTLGHDYGDKLLKLVSDKLQTSIRESDIPSRPLQREGQIARFGGDEFTVLLTQLNNINDAALVANRIITDLSDPIMLNDFEVVVTPSIGISIYPNDAQTVTDLVKFADIAMYKAKDSGRHIYKFYSDSFNLSSKARLNLEEEMRFALLNDQFDLHFQPKVDLNSKLMVGAEALIRWRHPTRGLVSPGEFIPLAEESGLIVKIGEWVVETALKYLQNWESLGYDMVPISVNVSGMQFKRSALLDMIKDMLAMYKVKPSLLEIELTESIIMTDVDDNISRLYDIREKGVSISVDDFGTGYSSLSYLKNLPIDILKIDRSFITELSTNQQDAGVVEAILNLSKSLGLKVVAEGVEEPEQLTVLKSMGCEVIQGYVFSKPMTPIAFSALMAQPSHLRNKWIN